jgi:type IV pilus assembly protein PilB
LERPVLEDMLRNCLLFHGADDHAIAVIADSLNEDSYKKGDPIILEGQLSDNVYFVTAGSVEIMKYRPEIQMVKQVVVLKAGSYFSEFSVLNRVNKSASAFAMEDCVLHRMDGATFLSLIQKIPGCARRLVMTLAELNSNSTSGSALEYFDPSSIEFSADIAKFLPNSLWKKYGILPLNHHGGILHIATKNPNRTDFFEFCKTAWPSAQVTLALVGESDFEQAFKRMSKMYNHTEMTKAPLPPVHTPVVEAVGDCLKHTPYFENADEEGLHSIAGLFEVIDVPTGHAIFKPGDEATHFYVVLSGHVELNHQTADKAAWTGSRARKGRMGFGEVSLLLNHPHTHFARAIAASKVLCLTKAKFEQLMASPAFCVNVAKVLAIRLQNATEATAHKFFDESKPLQIKELAKLIPKQTMTLQQIIPLRLEGKDITLGMVNPGNDAIYSVAHRYLRGFRINTEVLPLDKFTLFLTQAETLAVKAAHHEPAGAPAHAPAHAPSAAVANEGTVVELNRLVADGFDSRASDMHLEPTGTGYSVRYRIDGVLTEVSNQISQKQGETLVNRIKVLSQLDISNHFTPQDGQLKIVEDNRDFIARIATTPTKQGEGVVMRLIRNRNSAVPLTMLTPVPRTIKLMRSISRLKQGLFLVTGPTGSGKTTTLYSLIAELNRVDVKIISLEDPVELEIAGVTQIEINEKMGLTFDRALRSTLRQDPDVMMLGEIRDAESAKSVFEAALQGHLVISTLHTNNSFAVKSRLKELGVPLPSIAAGLVGSAAQRLVRSICKKCRIQRPITKSERELLAARLQLPVIPDHVWGAKGCVMCNHSGYSGRIPIIEVWQKTRGVEELLAKDATIDELNQEAKKDGFTSLFDTGLLMALNGLTTIEEIERCMFGNL